MITAAHVIVYSRDAEADRAFIRDVLGFESVDAGGGWLIFALPPAEVAVHPAEQPGHELYLMCDDIDATVDEIQKRGATIRLPVLEERWGRLVHIKLPGGGELALYQPKHPIAARLTKA
jgi:predicted enzyme related to lactoylglutathione lyase